MVYDNNIPQPTDNISTKSQADLLENFAQLNTQFAVDHIPLIAAANNGQHTKVTVNDVSADPGQAFPITSIYTKHVGAAPNRYTNLYFEADPENAVAASQFPINCIKAWCRFDGTAASPIAITDGFNVTNVTKPSLGTYTINFTNALQNANYVIFGSSTITTPLVPLSLATTNAQVRIGVGGSDSNIVSIVIIGN